MSALRALLVLVAVVAMASPGILLAEPHVMASAPRPPAVSVGAPTRAPAATPTTATPTADAGPSGFQWTEWNGTQPLVRTWEAMAYDPAAGYELMFGGYNDVGNEGDLSSGAGHIVPDWPPGTYLNDTWIYRNQTWTELCSGNSTTPRCAVNPWYGAASAAYDPKLGGVVLIDDYAHTYLFRSGAWTELNVTGTPWDCDWLQCGQSQAPMVYDPALGAVVFVQPQGYTYAFNGTNWAQVSTVMDVGGCYGYQTNAGGSLYFDPTVHDLVFVCGLNGSAYQFDNGSWSAVHLEGRPGGSILSADYDPGAEELVALVTTAATTSGRPGLPSAWVLRNDSWVNLSVAAGGYPPTDGYETMGWDAADQDFVVLDGSSAQDYWYGQGFNTTWTGSPPIDAIASVSAGSIGLGQNLTLFWNVSGGMQPVTSVVTSVPPGCATPFEDVAETCVPTSVGDFSFAISVDSPVMRAPLAVSSPVQVWSGMIASAEANRTWAYVDELVAYSIRPLGGEPPYRGVWSWDDGTETDAITTAHAYAAAGWHAASYSVSDSLGDTRSGTVSVFVDAPVATLPVANESTTDVGVPVGFIAVVHGGTGPYSGRWSFPSGGSAIGLAATWTFPEPGPQNVGLAVTDAVGASASAGTQVTVNPDPELSFGASLGSTSPNVPIEFAVSVLGGTGPYELRLMYGDGYEDTAPTDLAYATSHAFSTPGTYTVTAAVTDSVGGTGAASINITILGLPTTGPAPPNARAASSSNSPMPMTMAGFVILLAVAVSALGIIAASRRASRRRVRAAVRTRSRPPN